MWKFYKKNTNDTATCTLCPKIISCSGKSTSGLLRHMKSLHKTTWEKEVAGNNQDVPEKIRRTQPTLDLRKKEDVSSIVSKLAAIDGLSIRAITRSEFIRQSMSSQGLMLPKTRVRSARFVNKQISRG